MLCQRLGSWRVYGRSDLVHCCGHRVGFSHEQNRGVLRQETYQMLKGVSTESKAELARKIHLYFAKVKGVPVVYR